MSTKGRKADLRVIEGGTTAEVSQFDVPAHINPAMHGEWRDVVADLKRRRIFTDAMLGAVEAYIMALWSMRQAQKALDDHGQLVVGPKGTLMKNPAVTLHGKAQATVMRLSAELGLTPAARSRPKMKEEGDDAEGTQIDMFGRPVGGQHLLDF